MKLIMVINPGGVGCRYLRKGVKNTFGAVKIAARWGKMKTGYRWYAVQPIPIVVKFDGRLRRTTPFVVSAADLRRDYDPIFTKAKL